MIEYTLTRSNRKTIAIYIRGGRVEVKAPKRTSKREIEAFITKKQDWIEKHLNTVSAIDFDTLTDSEIAVAKGFARMKLVEKTRKFAEIMGVADKVNSVKINSAKSRWGSCSSKGNINYSFRIALVGTENFDYLADYLVVHE
jgi:predicted metal-dependent hydrolase